MALVVSLWGPVSGFNGVFPSGVAGIRIGLVGTGATGSTLAGLLMERGQHSVTLVDPDRLEERNRATSPFLRHAFDEQDARRESEVAPFKVDLVAQSAERLGLAGWAALSAEIADVGWQDLLPCDVLCCCTDSVISRVETAYTARMLGRPMLEAGVADVGEVACRVAWFPSSADAGCYLCGLGEDRRAQVLAHAAAASHGCAPLAEAESMTGAPAAVQHAAEEMMARLQRMAEGSLPAKTAQAWRYAGAADASGGVRWAGTPAEQVRSRSCPWHEASPEEWIALPWETPLDDSLRGGRGSGSHPATGLALVYGGAMRAVRGVCATNAAARLHAPPRRMPSLRRGGVA